MSLQHFRLPPNGGGGLKRVRRIPPNHSISKRPLVRQRLCACLSVCEGVCEEVYVYKKDQKVYMN